MPEAQIQGLKPKEMDSFMDSEMNKESILADINRRAEEELKQEAANIKSKSLFMPANDSSFYLPKVSTNVNITKEFQ